MDLIGELTDGGGIIRTAEHRGQRNQISRAVDSGALVRLLPGVVVARELVDDPVVRARAAIAWQPRGVLLGRIAARLSFWPQCPVDAIDLNAPPSRHRPRIIRPHQRRIPADHLMSWGTALLTIPERTVLDLAQAGDWPPLCEALRSRAVTAASLAQIAASLAGRPGADARRECVIRAEGNPWSVPEMDLQRLYRNAGITGWVGNQRLRIGQTTLFPDIRFDRERVLVEVDSRRHHTQAEYFERDRARHNLVAADDWALLTFTPHAIWTNPEQVLAQTRAVLRLRRA